MLKIEALRGHIPDSVLAQIPDTCQKFGITTNLRLAHFLSQCAHESGVFRTVSENLSYSDVNRIAQIFKNDVDANHNKVIEASELDHARNYVKKPKELGNFVYANQNGNGSEASGDGYNYRGRGYIQLTGRANYKAFSDFIGEDCIANPDLVATKYPLASAAFYFNSRKLWATCDLGESEDVVKKVTKLVNGGNIGLNERLLEFTKFYNLLK